MDNLYDLGQRLVKVLEAKINSLNDENVTLKGELCFRLADMKMRQFSKWGRAEDLDEAIAKGRMCVENIGQEHGSYVSALSNLGGYLENRYEISGDVRDLEDAIQLAQQAITTSPEKSNSLAVLQNNLGNKLLRRYTRTGNVNDLEEATQLVRQAVDATTGDDPSISLRLSNLGNVLECRFKRAGDLNDLEEAIAVTQKAIEKASEENPSLAGFLSNLGIKLEARYERTGKLEDLEEAIRVTRRAIDITPEGHRDRATWLNNLGTKVECLYQRNGNRTDLEEAIQISRQAVEALTADHPIMSTVLNNLANKLEKQYKATKEMGYLEESIQIARKTVDVTPKHHLDLGAWLNDLGMKLSARYQATKDMNDLEEAIQVAREAIDETPTDHPNLCVCLINLASRLKLKHLQSNFPVSAKSSSDLEIYDILKKALEHTPAPPLERIRAGRRAAVNAAYRQSWHEAANNLQMALDLLPNVTPRSNSRSDLQHVLTTLSGLASLTASIFLKAGRSAADALQALEQTRGIISGFMIDLKSDISLLKQHQPQLWSRYTQCQQQIMNINTASDASKASLDLSYTHRSNHLQQLYQDLDDLHVEVRKYAGFERFLLPPSAMEMRDLAKEGSIVCFNVSPISSEAILVTSAGIDALPLPELKEEDIRVHVRLLNSRGNLRRRDIVVHDDDEDDHQETSTSYHLLALWNNAVEPVLEKLGFLTQKEPNTVLPRIWWVGGGTMALLPIHAAGFHSLESTKNAMSHAISSYAPTIKSLQFVKQRESFSTINRSINVLVVSMPTTPGLHGTLNVGPEVAAIQKYSESFDSINHLQNPTKDKVLEGLKTCTVAHFACHGIADRIEPAKSALVIGKDKEERLTIQDLDALSQSTAQIAYLSACSTAEIKTISLADESIHLASTFQLGGFQHVIGTLWGADDSAAVEIASKFYEGLLQQSETGINSVHQALHDAVIYFRGKDGNNQDISKWAPFIHLGC